MVGTDAQHRNWGTAALALRVMSVGEGARFGVTLGVGALFDDDVSETDPDFRSSARGEEMVLPGIEARFPVGPSWGLTIFARDQLTGWMNALFDRAEQDLAHRLLFGVGAYFW
jgi:hypothetical protein